MLGETEIKEEFTDATLLRKEFQRQSSSNNILVGNINGIGYRKYFSTFLLSQGNLIYHLVQKIET